MILPHHDGWIEECWGRVVIGIGGGNGKFVMAAILEEVSSLRFDAGVQHEIERRTREIAERLMGNSRVCVSCKEYFTPRVLHGGPYYCDSCDNENIPF